MFSRLGVCECESSVLDMCRSALGPLHRYRARMDRDCDLWGAESHEWRLQTARDEMLDHH